MASVGEGLNGVILAGLSAEDIEMTERALSVKKDNIRRGIVGQNKAELPMGVFEPVSQPTT